MKVTELLEYYKSDTTNKVRLYNENIDQLKLDKYLNEEVEYFEICNFNGVSYLDIVIKKIAPRTLIQVLREIECEYNHLLECIEINENFKNGKRMYKKLTYHFLGNDISQAVYVSVNYTSNTIMYGIQGIEGFKMYDYEDEDE